MRVWAKAHSDVERHREDDDTDHGGCGRVPRLARALRVAGIHVEAACQHHELARDPDRQGELPGTRRSPRHYAHPPAPLFVTSISDGRDYNKVQECTQTHC
jgi:hypothetical protein